MYLTKLKQYPQNNHKVTKREKYREGLFAGGKKKKKKCDCHKDTIFSVNYFYELSFKTRTFCIADQLKTNPFEI